jgi:hypothetical protein
MTNLDRRQLLTAGALGGTSDVFSAEGWATVSRQAVA